MNAPSLTLGSLAYSIGVTRSLGLVVFPEQFLAAAYGVCLALLFVSFPARRGTPRADIPWFDWFFAIAGLGEAAGTAATWRAVPVVRESDGLTITLSDGVTP